MYGGFFVTPLIKAVILFIQIQTPWHCSLLMVHLKQNHHRGAALTWAACIMGILSGEICLFFNIVKGCSLPENGTFQDAMWNITF